MGSFLKECGCSRPTRCPHPYVIRFRDALGKQREEAGFGTQDDAIERLTQVFAGKKTAPSVAEARRELGQQTVAEYAKQWRPRQRKMTEYSTGWHVDISINVHVVPRLGSRKLNSVTPIVVERFLGRARKSGQHLPHPEGRSAGRVRQGRDGGGPIAASAGTAQASTCSTARLPLPDASCTSGAYNPDVTQSTINSTICVSGWTATVRPPTSCTNPLKAQSIIDYGYFDTNIATTRNHLVPLELGDAPRDPGNLWPELCAGAAWNQKG